MKNGAINEDVSMRVLLYQYRQSLREAKKMLRPFDKEKLTEQEQADKTLINSMIRDLEYAIEWLRNGRNPDAMRGVDKTGVYTLDPNLLESIIPNRSVVVDRKITTEEKWLLDDVLGDLTTREKDVFTLVRAERLSYEYTAELLGITKSSVQTYLKRAEQKIKERKNSSLFLVS